MTPIQGLFCRAEAWLGSLSDNPEAAVPELERIHRSIADEIQTAGEKIVYRLSGVDPAKATPMQYGGLFLERDRELLALAKARGEVWLLVDAGPGAYLDFVSDLPADVFCWNARETGFSLSEMRKLRQGRLCTNEPGADEDFSVFETSKEPQGVGN